MDSVFYGSKLRFVNHGICGVENSHPEYRFSRGVLHIGLYALKKIPRGQEILFNYGKHYQLDWLIEYNKKIKKQMEEENRKKKLKKKKKNEGNINLFEKSINDGPIFSDLEDD